MRYAIAHLLVAVTCTYPANAQGSRPASDTLSTGQSVSDTTSLNDFPQPEKPKLLPDDMSFVERGLWGENGLFRSIGIASPLTPDVRRSELGVRRTMLTTHQIGGFVTVGLIATTIYYGQMSLDHPQNRGYRQYHQGFVTAAIISYGATGALAVLSPPPLIRRDEVSTTTIHKALAWVHFVGMVATPIMGTLLKRNFQHDGLTRFHQISAYLTGATLAVSLIVVTF